MKLKLLLCLSLFFLSSCSPSTKEPDSIAPSQGDGYVDTLPQKVEDGVFLHAFGWTFNQIRENLDGIKEAGFRAVQTSPVQQPKNGGVKWEYFYQPCSFSIAESSPLGTKEELTALCKEAKEKGISVIADIVFNHMATTGNKKSNGTYEIDPQVNEYEPYIYENQETMFHQVTSSYGSGTTTQIYPGLPDLNTANPYIQERAYSLLKECIDVGIEGFRFDAAKHIETPEDPNFASSFWDNTLEKAKSYYKEKNGTDLYAYGEILNDINEDGSKRTNDMYTKYMKITDNTYNSSLQSAIYGKKSADQLVSVAYGKKTAAKNLLTWNESHDQYCSSAQHYSDKKMARIWAVVASRKDTNSLFLARPDENQSVGKIADYAFEKDPIAAVNRFHNRYIEAQEEIHAEENCYINERYSDSLSGAMIIDVGLNGKAKLTFQKLADGWYFDQLNGKAVQVKDRQAEIEFSESGIAILTPSKNALRPVIEVDNHGGQFASSFVVNCTVGNADRISYSIDGKKTEVSDSSFQVTIGSDTEVGKSVSLTIEAANADFSIKRTFTYTKIYLIPDAFNVIHLNPDYLTETELYIWAWPKGGNGSYSQDYTWNEEHQILLIDQADSYGGFLLVRYQKGHKITNKNQFDSSESFIAQTGDINPADGFYDASQF